MGVWPGWPSKLVISEGAYSCLTDKCLCILLRVCIKCVAIYTEHTDISNNQRLYDECFVLFHDHFNAFCAVVQLCSSCKH